VGRKTRVVVNGFVIFDILRRKNAPYMAPKASDIRSDIFDDISHADSSPDFLSTGKDKSGNFAAVSISAPRRRWV